MSRRQDGLLASSWAMIREGARLMRDERGNTLAMAAAATIPLLGLVGSGIDLSRTYLAKNKLQQACDAGVLGGRKVMSTAVDAPVIAEVRKYVNFNFPQGTQQTAPFTINPTEGTNKSVDLTLSTTVPTSVMHLFGFASLPITTSCTARQDFINTDVMLVLDTTLSMNCLPSDGNILCTTKKTNSKIDGLKGAVVEFYRSLRDAQTRLEGAGLRLRYGVVPYSVTVNVGKLLYAKNSSYIRKNVNYQQCSNTAWDQACGTFTLKAVAHTDAWLQSASWAGCIEERQTVQTIGSSSGYTIPSGATDLDIDTAPTATDATKWAPYSPTHATAMKSSISALLTDACPREARSLAPFADEAALNTYLSTMNADGQTYHDIGLIWGARLFSNTGLWATDNPTSFNSFPVNRHMIFMTDGLMDPETNVYSAYGIENFTTAQGGRRVTSTANATDQNNSHIQRFRMMCNKIKSMNISLWVIEFGNASGTGLNPELVSCASNPTQVFKANNTAALNAHFKEIGESIGALRLSR
jgi:Flp pilus assembly protein TadG